ncbi:BON domain-containing protein [Aliiglaciecola sp. CAU 1673]|uniref:BON domain-containing protein n=1 Tax=Aliiglaciecola sp. CAU 1673 TaxID=3032595 RepID=UPI0023DB00E2|nr:BON domain-containing protein [Aliiglaciecola sp. CAU 1673]MDF2180367.1 BON domain-containing protein [Aliiglaciecola sp. CAU 1673]
MKMNSRKLILASTIAMLYLPSAMVVGSESTLSTDLKNARQEAQIWTTYQINPYLRDSSIDVKVTQGKVILQGTVTEEVDKELAAAIASGVSGVSSVDNQIVVDESYQQKTSPGDRSYAEMVEDVSISAAIKSKLLWSKFSNGVATEVDTYQGKVSLKGEVHDQSSKDALASLAKNTDGVVSVDNQLTIASEPKAEKVSMKEEKDQSMFNDGWITTKVKATYMYSSNVDSSDISVNTLDGIVSLEGLVKSGSERSLAIELAKNIRGVKDVSASKLVFQ